MDITLPNLSTPQKLPVLDLQALQKDVLKALRGSATSRELSSHLDYSFDQYARWEVGRVRLRWSSFVHVCALAGINLRDVFFSTYGFLPQKLSDSEGFARELFRGVVGPMGYHEMASHLGVPLGQIERWVYGRSEMTFQDVCIVLHRFTLQGFFAWLSHIVDLSRLPSVRHFAAQVETERSIHLAFPMAAAIEAALQLEAYQNNPEHDVGLIAKVTGLETDLIGRLLPLLESARRIRRVGGKYQVDETVVNVQGGSREAVSRLVKYWTEQALLRFQTQSGLPVTKRNNPNAVLFRVAPLSREASMAVTEALLRCHNEITKIIEEDHGPAEEVRVVIGHCFSADEKP